MEHHERNEVIAKNEDQSLNNYLDGRDKMSMNTCYRCGDVYDTDFQMEEDKDGNMICDNCAEEIELMTESSMP